MASKAVPDPLVEELGRYIVLRFENRDPVSIDTERYLTISKAKAEPQLIRYPTMLSYVGQLVETAREHAVNARHEAKVHEATLYRGFKEDGIKRTGDQIAAEIEVHETTIALKRKRIEYELLVGRLEKFYWSLRERGAVLKALLGVQGSEQNLTTHVSDYRSYTRPSQGA